MFRFSHWRCSAETPVRPTQLRPPRNRPQTPHGAPGAGGGAVGLTTPQRSAPTASPRQQRGSQQRSPSMRPVIIRCAICAVLALPSGGRASCLVDWAWKERIRNLIRRPAGGAGGEGVFGKNCHRKCHRTADYMLLQGGTTSSLDHRKSQQNWAIWDAALLTRTPLSKPRALCHQKQLHTRGGGGPTWRLRRSLLVTGK